MIIVNTYEYSEWIKFLEASHVLWFQMVPRLARMVHLACLRNGKKQRVKAGLNVVQIDVAEHQKKAALYRISSNAP